MRGDDVPLLSDGLHEVYMAFGKNAANVKYRFDVEVGEHIRF
jgi:hypothetical protein